MRKNPEHVDFFIRHGADVNDASAPLYAALCLREPITLYDNVLEKSVHWLTQHLSVDTKENQTEIVRLLLEAGTDPDGRPTPRGDRTPPLTGSGLTTRTFDLLMQHGADINLAQIENGRRGMTPLIQMAQYVSRKSPAREEMALFNKMLKAGADVNARDGNGQTALITVALDNDNVAQLKQLLKAGADIDAADIYGRTALMYAAHSARNPGAVLVLLKAGADKTLKDMHGRTALDFLKGNRTLRESAAYPRLSKAFE